MRVVVLLGLALLLPNTEARGEEATKRAQAFFQRAEAHFSRGEFPQALRLYLEAHRAKPMPELLFNVGQCHRHMGDHAKAIFFYQQFLEQKPRSQQRAQVQQLVDECQAALDKQRRAERCPSAAGCPARGTATRVLFWSTVGLAGALVLGGAITGGLAVRQDSEYSLATTSPARRQELGETRRKLEIASWTCLGLAAGAGVGAALLGWLTRPGRARKVTTISPALVASGGGVVVGGRF
jgi:tetratricopeptide (TPR) repeat protein